MHWIGGVARADLLRLVSARFCFSSRPGRCPVAACATPDAVPSLAATPGRRQPSSCSAKCTTTPSSIGLRLDALRRAFAAGWRPAIVMEQFDRERQADIERARRERPRDAQHVIDLAAAAATRPAAAGSWDFYRPFVALALEHDVPLIAGNLSSADATRDRARAAMRRVRCGVGAALGLDRPIDAAWQRAQEREIDAGHCRALPAALWPRMAARPVRARRGAWRVRSPAHAGRGAVLLAGNGHVRRDIGVPRWLSLDPGRVWSVGYLEAGDDVTPAAAFDAVVRTKPAERSDPCAAFEARRRRRARPPD